MYRGEDIRGWFCFIVAPAEHVWGVISGSPLTFSALPHFARRLRQLALDLGMVPVVPPKSNRLHPWDYDHAIYKKRNEIERLFRRLKGFRRIFSRFEKLDVLFLGFLSFALIVEALRVV